jgi:hypothetical protein
MVWLRRTEHRWLVVLDNLDSPADAGIRLPDPVVAAPHQLTGGRIITA